MATTTQRMLTDQRFSCPRPWSLTCNCNVASLYARRLTTAGLLLAASIGGNLVGVRIAGKILKWEKGEASIIGWLLQTKVLIMIIFVNILLDKGIITCGMFTALLLMAIASTMLTVPVVYPKLRQMKSLVFKFTS